MATKLGVMNAALLELGDRELSDTGEAVESARKLLSAYDNVVGDCLEAGYWNFATQSLQIAGDTGVAPSFGFTEGFAKPSDWVRTVAISQDPYFSTPLIYYYDDDDFWFADGTPIYVRYVSNDTGLGLDLSHWPRSFTRFVELELAARVAPRFESVNDIERLKLDRDKARRRALAVDAENRAQPKFAPPSSWTTARSGRTSGNDGGNRGSLIG